MGHDRTARRKVGRPDERRREIAAALKAKIVSGDWSPGARIPTRRALCDEFDASPVTIQQILNELAEDGFTYADGRNGTFLSSRPPHLVNIAFVMSVDESHNRLWRALSHEAAKPRDDGLAIRIWRNIDGHQENPEFQGLLEDIRRRRLLGIFFASSPFMVEDTPIVTEPGIPRVAVMSPGPGFQDVSKLGFDGRSFQAKALSWLRSRGRRRVAVIGHPEISLLDWRERILEAGFHTDCKWILGVDLKRSLPATNLTRLLLDPGNPERPDGLIVTDDNILESVSLGVAASQVEIPKDLDIVAHCNFPWPPASVVPVTYIGFDAKALFEAGVSLLKASSSGAPPATIDLPAIFESEFEPGPSR